MLCLAQNLGQVASWVSRTLIYKFFFLKSIFIFIKHSQNGLASPNSIWKYEPASLKPLCILKDLGRPY